jgi:chorismate mutase/prephenate dehydrogenase
MDITSLKEFPLRAMLESTSASVVGTHPMFGPSVHSLQGQRVVICSGRGTEWEQWLRAQLQAAGLILKDASAAEHDRIMAVVQVLTHYRTQVVGLALARLGVSIEESLAFTSPIYQMELWMTGRHFAQSPQLYGPIEMLNPRSTEVTQAFRDAAEDVAHALEKRDLTRFAQLFEEVRTYFGDFTRVAQEQSSHLIDRAVERA